MKIEGVKFSKCEVRNLIKLSRRVAWHVFLHHEFDCHELDKKAGELFKFLDYKHVLHNQMLEDE